MAVAVVAAASVAAFALALESSPGPVETLYASSIDSPEVPPQMAESVNEFAFDFYRKLSETDENNVFFSPVSIYTAFSVLYEGARGDTAGQMLGVFGFEPDDEARHAASADMMAALNAEDPHAILEMANALWLADWFQPYEKYLDIARNTYLATVETVDFAGEGKPGVKKVNDWAAEKTRDKITGVLPGSSVDDSTAAVITNAVYFKGTWLVQFPKEDTREGKFWRGEDGIDAEFMHVKDNFGYADTGGTQVLRLPYEGDRLSMLAVLPGGTGGLERLEAEMSAKQMSEYIEMLEPQDVVVSLPKFETKTKYDLQKSLVDLGMPDVFTAIADLSGLSDNDNLYVDRATHDAYVKVNEEGTEAAAVTVISMSESQPPPLPHFNADHPFLFIIYDEQSGLILFMGRISDPTA